LHIKIPYVILRKTTEFRSILVSEKRTITQYCGELAWGSADLAREAGISIDTARRVLAAYEPSNRVKREICKALSTALARQIKPGEIQWEV
jgi:hypothetical protein